MSYVSIFVFLSGFIFLQKYPKLRGEGLAAFGGIVYCLGFYLFYFEPDWLSAGFGSQNSKNVMEGVLVLLGIILILVGSLHSINSRAIESLKESVKKLEGSKTN